MNQHDIFTLRGIGVQPIKFPMIPRTDGVCSIPDSPTPEQKYLIYNVISSDGYHGDETLDPGRTVLNETYPGTLAQYIAIPRANLIPHPPNMDSTHVAALGTAWLVAYRALFTKSRLRPGQKLLIQGSSGGITVWTTGRSSDKRALAAQLGASKTFSPDAAPPEKVDAVFNTAGAANVGTRHRERQSGGGVVIVCGMHSGQDPPARLMRVFVEQIDVRGVYAGRSGS